MSNQAEAGKNINNGIMGDHIETGKNIDNGNLKFSGLAEKSRSDNFIYTYLSFNLGIFLICPFLLSKAVFVFLHNASHMDLEINEAGTSFFNLVKDFNTSPVKILIWFACVGLIAFFVAKAAKADKEKGTKMAIAVVTSLQSFAILVLFLLIMYASDTFIII
ncbi:MAG: hypothetical protein LWY06_06000 [Firmicutes bacterium]|nr:hypothetical protein [Bacillota bacterium]